MSDDNKMVVSIRTSFGKGAARKLRAAGQVPAVLYGHGTDPQHLALPGHETMLRTRQANALLELDIEGASQLALVKDVQRDPVRQIIEHLDLLIVKKGERVEVEVPVHIVGEPAPGTEFMQDAATILVTAEATNIPTNIEVSIAGLESGTLLHDNEIELPKGVELVETPEPVLLVSIHTPQAQDLGDEEAGESEAAGEAEAPAAAAE